MLRSRYVYNKESFVKSIRKEKRQQPRGKWLFPSFLSRQLVRYLFLSNRCCSEILTRPGSKIHSKSVPPPHSFSAATSFRQKLNGFFITFCFVQLQARNRPVGYTGDYYMATIVCALSLAAERTLFSCNDRAL